MTRGDWMGVFGIFLMAVGVCASAFIPILIEKMIKEWKRGKIKS